MIFRPLMEIKNIPSTDKYEEELPFGDFLDKHDYPNGNWFMKEKPKDCYEFQAIVHEAYGNGSLAGIQGDYCCVVSLKGERTGSVTLAYDYDCKEYYLQIEEVIE